MRARYGAVTRLILMHDLGLSPAGSTRAISTLISCGVLRLSIPLPRPKDKKGGPRVKVFEYTCALYVEGNRIIIESISLE